MRRYGDQEKLTKIICVNNIINYLKKDIDESSSSKVVRCHYMTLYLYDVDCIKVLASNN
jgi:hypothetical protein